MQTQEVVQLNDSRPDAQVARRFVDSHEHAAFVRQQLGGDNLLVESWSEPVQAAYSQAEGASDFVAIAKAGAISALQLYSRTDLELWGIAQGARGHTSSSKRGRNCNDHGKAASANSNFTGVNTVGIITIVTLGIINQQTL